MKGCDGGTIPKRVGKSEEPFYLDRDFKIDFCPKIVLFDDDTIEIIELYEFFQKGILYQDGGISQQPFWYVETMRAIDSKVRQWQMSNSQQ